MEHPTVHYLEKWRHFVSPKTLLCFKVRARVSGNTFSVKRYGASVVDPILLATTFLNAVQNIIQIVGICR